MNMCGIQERTCYFVQCGKRKTRSKERLIINRNDKIGPANDLFGQGLEVILTKSRELLIKSQERLTKHR